MVKKKSSIKIEMPSKLALGVNHLKRTIDGVDDILSIYAFGKEIVEARARVDRNWENLKKRSEDHTP